MVLTRRGTGPKRAKSYACVRVHACVRARTCVCARVRVRMRADCASAHVTDSLLPQGFVGATIGPPNSRTSGSANVALTQEEMGLSSQVLKGYGEARRCRDNAQ